MNNSKNESSANEPTCFKRGNYIIMATSAVIVASGFIMMSGSGSTTRIFRPEIFNDLRVVYAPTMCFCGYVMMIVAIMADFKSRRGR